MTDDKRLRPLGQFTAAGKLTPGYGVHYVFFAGEDDIHGILRYLVQNETQEFKFNAYAYTDVELNGDIISLVRSGVRVQGALDWSEALSVNAFPSETNLIAADEALGSVFYDNFRSMKSATKQISHTKGGVLLGQGIGFEGSVNWTKTGEGIGINVTGPEPKGWYSQNNTLVVSTSKVFVTRFTARLDTEWAYGQPFPAQNTPLMAVPREMMLDN